jgi:hypothetical protein
MQEFVMNPTGKSPFSATPSATVAALNIRVGFSDPASDNNTLRDNRSAIERARTRNRSMYFGRESTAARDAGVVSHGTDLVEHPKLGADRIITFAEIVGQEHVIAGADWAAASIRKSPPNSRFLLRDLTADLQTRNQKLRN